jgi:hypothetical protein
VDKNSFLGIAKSFGSDSAEEAHDLLLLRTQYPFSQILHILAAKVAKDLNLPSQQHDLQSAAVYSTDRSVLKDVMLEPFSRESELITPQANQEPGPTWSSTPELIVKHDGQAVAADVDNAFDKIDVAETVMNDLRRLNELKHNFELLFSDSASISVPVQAASPATDDKAKMEDATRDIEPLSEPKPVATVPTRRKKREPQADLNILDEIKISKEEIALETERQKQQIELIDQFIKAQPSITTNAAKEKTPAALPATDLNSIKSGEFSDNIISETLVEILLKQGKKDRAIEVLKKLIWKYPQKKAYFASRIEDLKK